MTSRVIQKFQVHLKAELENLTNLLPQGRDHRYSIKFRCSKCSDFSELIPFSGEVRTANLVMKCKFCKVESTANIELPTQRPYTAEDSGKFAPWVVIEARGIEPMEYAIQDLCTAEGVDSGTVFSDIDLSSGDWAEYDEKAGNSVSILDIETKITKA
ncbi:hypothetical protein BJ742DRAFT_672978 [Cladochytrium replicatum]|nr:hypothetical protein BJ742DRAFT_672978 [Cladochytrium replicatum]